MGVEPILCRGSVIIHLNRVVTCTDPTCDAAAHGIGVVLDRHDWFVSCSTTLGYQCPLCYPPGI
jgi:hypothetical protein